MGDADWNHTDGPFRAVRPRDIYGVPYQLSTQMTGDVCQQKRAMGP